MGCSIEIISQARWLTEFHGGDVSKVYYPGSRAVKRLRRAAKEKTSPKAPKKSGDKEGFTRIYENPAGWVETHVSGSKVRFNRISPWRGASPETKPNLARIWNVIRLVLTSG